MTIQDEVVIHIQPGDLYKKDWKPKNPKIKIWPSVIIVHSDISVADFLQTPIWSSLYDAIEPGKEYVIVTQFSPMYQQSLSNIQFR